MELAMTLRSNEWYAGEDRNAYIHRAWMRRGVPDDAFRGRPQIAIANTASDLTPCNAHLSGVAQFVDRKSTRLNSSHVSISYAVFSLKIKNNKEYASQQSLILLGRA